MSCEFLIIFLSIFAGIFDCRSMPLSCMFSDGSKTEILPSLNLVAAMEISCLKLRNFSKTYSLLKSSLLSISSTDLNLY